MNKAESSLVMAMVQQACPAQKFPDSKDEEILAAEIAAAKTIWHLTLQAYTLAEAVTAVEKLTGARYISPGEIRDEIKVARRFRTDHDVAAVIAPITPAEAEEVLARIYRQIKARGYRPATRRAIEAPESPFAGFPGRDELRRDPHPVAQETREHLRSVPSLRPRPEEDRPYVVARAELALIADPAVVEGYITAARRELGDEAATRDVVVRAAGLARDAERAAAG